jgi:hypothetical protein
LTKAIAGEVIRPPEPKRSVAGLTKGYPANRRPDFRLRFIDYAVRVYGEDVGGLVSTIVETMWRKQIPVSIAQQMLARLIPEHLPQDLSALPETIRTAVDWERAIDELYRARRSGKLTDSQWRELREGCTATWRAICEAKAQQGERT